MNPMRMTSLSTTLLAALAPEGLARVMSMMITNVASAQPAGGARRGPPPEALAACKSLASGADCEFSGPQGTRLVRLQKASVLEHTVMQEIEIELDLAEIAFDRLDARRHE